MAVNYVQFYRGSLQAYEAATKNKDTLYFVTNSDDNKSYLYLGDKLITGSITDLSGLEDILFTELGNNHLMVFDKTQEKWVNKSVLDAIGIMSGASADGQGSNGLVPAPGAGMQDAFLRGDGTWAKISVSEGIALTADEKSVSILNKTIALKDFGAKYYKFVAATDTVEAHYEAQLVDATHPWMAGLEPKVVEDNGELVLGWFEPNTEAIDKLNSKVTSLEDSIKTLNIEVISVKDVANILNSQKANISDVYTKSETDTKISEAIVSAQHLKRKTFATLEEARNFANSITNADEYIFMVSNTSTSENKYDEYLFVEGELEKVGAWDVDLTDYTTKQEIETKLSTKVDKIEGHSLISNDDLTKLSSIEEYAQVNKIDTVDEIEFNLINKHLSLNNIAMSKVTGLENILGKKAEKTEVEEIKTKANTLESNLNIMSKKVIDLEEILRNNSYVTQDELTSELAPLKEAVTWQDI